MSYCTYIASDYPLETVKNPHDLCNDRVIEINVDTGEFRDGDYDDDFAFYPAMEMDDVYTEKKYAVYLEWHRYTVGRANKIIEYIKENLKHTDEVEIWRIWMGGYETPTIRTKRMFIDELTPENIRQIDEQAVEIKNVEGYEMPTQYRWVIRKRT